MIAKCGCRPGTREDGWQEVKSPACRQIELDALHEAMERQRNQTSIVRLYPKNDIGPITLFVRQNGRLVRVVTVP